MPYENICPDCGASLDPGEKCDCKKEEGTDIIAVKQLPVIAERLRSIKGQIESRAKSALSLECTEETVKKVKAMRAELSKDFKDLEEKRREVKKAILAPYNDFEVLYKECVTDVFGFADRELKGKIDSVENGLKEQKAAEVKAYFDEYLQSLGIDFVTYETAHINVTLSASMKSLKEAAKAFADRICDDLRLIETQEHKDEILYEYRQSLNVSEAIEAVINRRKALYKEEQKEEPAKKAPLPEEKQLSPPVCEEPVLTLKFTVRAPRPKLKELKDFLDNGGYDYE